MSDRPPPREAAPNQRLWDTWAKLHEGTAFYSLDGLRRGGVTLTDLDLEEVGPVANKTLLHLQCHSGHDTLSWARLGARVTGVDFSPVAIEQARQLSRELDLDARFICADIESFKQEPPERFDIVYTSFGVLTWLSDLRPWARLIARHLKPGGTFHLIEFHPVFGMFDENGEQLRYPYFRTVEPLIIKETKSYAGASHEPMLTYQWSHSIAEVIQSLIDAGLAITRFRELPYCLHRCYESLVETEPGQYVLRRHPTGVPLLFALQATSAAR